MAFESTLDSMAGIIPVAMMGGLALGFTQQAMSIPGRIQAESYEVRRPRRTRKPAVEGDAMLHKLFG